MASDFRDADLDYAKGTKHYLKNDNNALMFFAEHVCIRDENYKCRSGMYLNKIIAFIDTQFRNKEVFTEADKRLLARMNQFVEKYKDKVLKGNDVSHES